MLNQSTISAYHDLLLTTNDLSSAVASILTSPVFQEYTNLSTLISTLLKSPFYVHRLAVCYLLPHASKSVFYALFNDNIQLVCRTAMELLPAGMLTHSEILVCLEALEQKNDYLQCGAVDLLSKLDVWTDRIHYFLRSVSWRVRFSLAKKIDKLSVFYRDVYDALKDDDVLFIKKAMICALKNDDILYFLRSEDEEIRCEVVKEIWKRTADGSGFAYLKDWIERGNEDLKDTMEGSELTRSNDLGNGKGIKRRSTAKKSEKDKKGGNNEQENTKDMNEPISDRSRAPMNDEEHVYLAVSRARDEMTVEEYTQLITDTCPDVLKSDLPSFLMKDPSSKVKFHLLKLLKTKNLVQQFINSSDWREREQALEYSLDSDLYFSFLVDPVAQVRYKAAMSFQQPLNAATIGNLGKIVHSDNYLYRINVIHVLVSNANESMRELLDVLSRDKIVNVREKVLSVVESEKAVYYSSIVEQMADDENEEVCRRAERVLRVLKGL